MAIVGQNALLNQYVPTFYIRDLVDSQILKYDSVRRAFVNVDGGGGTSIDRLGELLDVDESVDNPLSVQNGQALVYDSGTSLWVNKFVDYTTLLNKPDLTVTLTGDVTGTGIGNIATTLADVNTTVGTFGNGLNVPQITVDAKGRITNVVNVPITGGGGSGSVTSISGLGTQGVTVDVTNPTSTPLITVGLGDITPLSVTASGNIVAANLSGINTGDQTITLEGDVTGSGTGTFTTTLATVNLTPGTYGDAHFVPTMVVNEKGLVTSVTTQHVDTSVVDVIPPEQTLTIDPRHQYIVTTVLEVDGYIINNGVIAIL